MSTNGFIGKANLRVGLSRKGVLLPFGSEQECTQAELDGGYFDKTTFEPSANGSKMMASPDNKSLSSVSTKSTKKKKKD